MQDERDKVDGIVVVPEQSEKYLNQRQLEDYHSFRSQLLKWLLNLGKDPEMAEGYAFDTVRQRGYKIDQFYRWIWRQEDGYTLRVTTGHADEYCKELVYEETSKTHKAAVQKAIKSLFKYLNHERGRSIDWEPEIKFSSGGATHQIRDFLTGDERRKIKQASLEYGSIPHYNSLDPRERDKWKAHLAQRFEKPKTEVTRNDWERANGWKYPSIVYTSMDAGLRPKEVGRAKTSWLDLENGMLRIPKDESTKNTDNWHVALSDRTSNILRKWVSERENYEKYRGTEALWLTKYGNPYGSSSLNRLLGKLCEEARIPVKNRDMSWYSIRHSVGTQMSRDQGPAAVQQQLRQKSYEMAVRYDQAPVDDRQETVNNWD
ncbi:tyrosine-type recombinase/integrase [Salinilacihabitans rarus]|uniref:tyrosine-type recombinase/integrase n=1 Tax=Salinilacihabitans rarus TaxID=2961596 RepID=UPI0020C8A4CC|nr:site-specific integrase [Salinilacihabitans rarus]